MAKCAMIYIISPHPAIRPQVHPQGNMLQVPVKDMDRYQDFVSPACCLIAKFCNKCCFACSCISLNSNKAISRKCFECTRSKNRAGRVGSDDSALVGTDLLPGSFVDVLRNRSVVRDAGATLLDGLVGNVAVPKKTGGASVYWVAEGSAPTESEATFGQVALSPKTCGT